MDSRARNSVTFGVFAVLSACVLSFLLPIRIVKELPLGVSSIPVVSATPEITKNKSAPSIIDIPKIGIHANIRPGTYNHDTGAWDLSWDAVQFADMTVAPNTLGGKTLLYAHNTRKLFGLTSKIALGDEATLTTTDGTTFHYVYAQEQVVDPTNTSILSNPQDGPPQLVLLTCSGIFNQNRRLLFFTLQS